MERKVVQSKSCFPLTAISISELCSGGDKPPKMDWYETAESTWHRTPQGAHKSGAQGPFLRYPASRLPPGDRILGSSFACGSGCRWASE